MNATEHPLSIDVGGVKISPACVLAPMEGITDRPFRRLIRGLGGCGLTVTEFVSSEGLNRKITRIWKMAEIDEDEHPVGIQIYGRHPHRMAEAARLCVDLGADLIDLNLGCPSKAVTSGCSGSALMKEPALAGEIFTAVKAAIEVPMTVKMRLGWSRDTMNAPEIARMAQDAGASMITVHGRTRMDGYRGQADWAALQKTKAAIDIPLLVNGDILTWQDAERALEASGADGVMVGRGLMRDPWLLRRCAEALAGRPPYHPTLRERREVQIRYFELICDEAPHEKAALGKLKKVTGFFTRGIPMGADLRKQVYHSHDVASAYAAVHRWFDEMEARGLEDGFTQVFAEAEDTYKETDSRRFDRTDHLVAQPTPGAPMAHGPDPATQRWLSEFLSARGAVAGSLHRPHEDGALHLEAWLNLPPPVVAITETIPKGKGMAGIAWAESRPVTTCNLKDDESGQVRPGAKAVDAMAAVALPVFDASAPDRLLGVVGLAFADDRDLPEGTLSAWVSASRSFLQ